MQTHSERALAHTGAVGSQQGALLKSTPAVNVEGGGSDVPLLTLPTVFLALATFQYQGLPSSHSCPS